MTNQSASSYNWLKKQVGLPENGACVDIWERIKGEMRGVTQSVVSIQDWVSDYWICKSAELRSGFSAKWAPPDHLDDWPMHTESTKYGDITNYAAFIKILDSSTDDSEYDSNEAVKRFYLLDDSWMTRGDVDMHQAEYVRAFLFIALGPLLMSITLSPQEYFNELVKETARRLAIPKSFTGKPLWGVYFSDNDLEILYNCRQSVDGNLTVSQTQVGQGDEWMKHWQWLSKSISFDDALVAVQMAAQLLRSRPLLAGILQALQSNDRGLEELSIAVLRRWLLTLKAMTWLEQALKDKWTYVRPADLACMAFNAVKPEWPKRLVSVSHRSFEVKPLLQQTAAWGSPLFAIDATYVPSWETNTGMIWGLFALSPNVTVVNSPHYFDSEWCRREAELIVYLRSNCDFYPNRQVKVITQDQLDVFNEFQETWLLDNGLYNSSGLNSINKFPPLCSVYVPSRHEVWSLKMLRAAGLLRIFYAVLNDSEMVNNLSAMLVNSKTDPPFPCFTNQQEGWQAYRDVFVDLTTVFTSEPKLHLWMQKQALTLNRNQSEEFLNKIPDLAEGNAKLEDVLVGLEWMKSLLPILQEGSVGDMILIDLRDLTKEIWERDPALSLARGIASLTQPPKPVWFIQKSGQEVEKWGLLGRDLPIFTQHTQKQYEWMWETSFSPDWTAHYATVCDLEMSEELKLKCREKR